MASQYIQMDRLDEAERVYKRILYTDPVDIDAIKALIGIYRRQGRDDLVLTYLEKLVKLEPDNIEERVQLGSMLQVRGQLGRARRCFRKALDLDPDRTGLYAMLANITQYTEYSEDIALLERRYEDPELTGSQRRVLAFSLGKIFDDLQEYDKAFEFFAEANRIAEKEYSRPIEHLMQQNGEVRAIFDHGLLQNYEQAGIDDDSIILVTGLARSGTTLVETILASHSLVYGVGEALIIGPTIRALFDESALLFPQDTRKLKIASIKAKAAEYVDRLKRRSEHSPYITDKNMGMVPFLGLFAVMLPNAKIIFCNRDPRDQGLSYFQKDFGPQQPYSYNLQTIGQYYRLQQDLMSHWEAVLPGRVYHVQYENLVFDTAGSVHGLLQFCGLEFEPACLRFYESERIVKTVSLAQVRRPIYETSIGRWKHYREQLGPLIAALESPHAN